MGIELSAPRGKRRQTVLSGPSTFAINSVVLTLISASGLVATANSSLTPVILSFAAGFGGRGAIDHIIRRQAINTVNLAPNAINYLYYQRNPSTGTISFGTTTEAPDYGPYPSRQVVGAAWFSTIDYVMRIWNGTVAGWGLVQRVYCGQVTTNASASTKVVTYAYNGEYLSPSTPVVAATAYNFEHNLGGSLFQQGFTVYGVGSGPAGIQHDLFFSGGLGHGYVGHAPSGNVYTIATGDRPVVNAPTGIWETSGVYWLRAERSF